MTAMVGQIPGATDVVAQLRALTGPPAATAQPAQSGSVAAAAPARAATEPGAVLEAVATAATLIEFERARVTYQPAADAADAAAVATPDGSAASASSAMTLRHVVVNVTTAWSQQLTAHVVASPAAAYSPAAQAPSAPAASNAATPQPSTSDPAIARLGLEDFNALRVRTVDRNRETTLSLKLETREGDLVELQFRQLDALTLTRLSGVSDSGQRIRIRDASDSQQRVVNMQISGDLSSEEKSAIDRVINSVIDVANQFFSGDLQAAMQTISSAEIDTAQLAEVSLRMSMSQSREMNKLVVGDDGAVRSLVRRDRGVGQALEFLADQQRLLITAAKAQFDDRSAVRLVKQLLPVMIAPQPAAPAPVDAQSAEVPAPADGVSTAA
jgi:hypothetical protein